MFPFFNNAFWEEAFEALRKEIKRITIHAILTFVLQVSLHYLRRKPFK